LGWKVFHLGCYGKVSAAAEFVGGEDVFPKKGKGKGSVGKKREGVLVKTNRGGREILALGFRKGR